MTLYEIKHRATGETLWSGEAASLRRAVEAAVAIGADLSGARLSGADLSGADLSGAHLDGYATGYLGAYGWCCIRQTADSETLLQYGCEQHPLSSWTEGLISTLCAKYEPRRPEYVARVTALVAYCRAVVGTKEVQP